MFKTITFCLVLFTVSFGYSFQKASKKNTLLTKKLKGKVKSVTTTTYSVTQVKGEIRKKSQTGLIAYEAFNSIGNIINERKTKPNGTIFQRQQYTYDQQDNNVEVRTISNGKVSKKTIYKYDRYSNKTAEYGYDKHNNLTHKILYSYSSQHKLKEMRVFKGNDNAWSYKHRFTFNSKNKLIGRHILDHSGRSQQWIHEYNEAEKSSKITILNQDQAMVSKSSFRFDDRENEIERTELNGANEVKRIIQTKYKYDKQGNWIKKTIFENQIPTSILERKIEYFD
ncbi:hypothetical protein BKI52_33725 [marine bacterium AO1-C]|nr:hypothetical protein BKI52_33725 [marine bacterium AO1-C]